MAVSCGIFVGFNQKARFLWNQKRVVIKWLGHLTFSTKRQSVAEIKKLYRLKKHEINESADYVDIQPDGIFANNELSLRHIEVYGFDYDYTLASYYDEIHHLIYNFAVDNLINKYGYPSLIRDMKYDPKFAIRGLHYDTDTGLLMKVDAFHNIMLGSVYRGLQPVSDEEVIRLYGGTHLAITKINPYQFLNNSQGPRRTMQHMIDMFSYPEMCLLSNAAELFIQKGIPYDPEYLYSDIVKAAQEVHSSGKMYNAVENDMGRYLEKSPRLREMLERQVSCGKKLFLITNSGFSFVNKGMEHMVGKGWQDLFEVVLTKARKPSFFNQTYRPFRCLDTTVYTPKWQKVTHFEKGEVYIEGNVEQFIKFTGWYGPTVLYLGDHVYSDLRDPVLKHGWRSGAIIPELEREIQTANALDYQRSVKWLLCLENVICRLQALDQTEEVFDLVEEWKQERRELRKKLKMMFNNQFGSVFRTYHNSTYFTRRLVRFADLYMSSLENLLGYTVNHTFYPRRTALPHEVPLDFES